MKILNYIVGFILMFSACCLDSEDYRPFLLTVGLCVLYFMAQIYFKNKEENE